MRNVLDVENKAVKIENEILIAKENNDLTLKNTLQVELDKFHSDTYPNTRFPGRRRLDLDHIFFWVPGMGGNLVVGEGGQTRTSPDAASDTVAKGALKKGWVENVGDDTSLWSTEVSDHIPVLADIEFRL